MVEIFVICERLAEILKEKEAIADLRRLYERHPEMFNDMQEVAKMINTVMKKPDFINKAHKENAILATKKMEYDGKFKIADVAIENTNGTNVIFHANKKRYTQKYIEKLKSDQLLVETPTPSTHESKFAGELAQASLTPSSKERSEANQKCIIAKNSKNSKSDDS